MGRSGRVPGIAPRHPPTPPDVRFSASGGWTVQSASFSDTQTLDLRTLRRVERLLRLARRLPVWGGDRSCRVPLLRSVVRHGVQCLDWLRSFLRPFARNAFLFVRSSIATMASADSPPLSRRGSPRVTVCSFRSRLWALQSAISGSWASCLLAHSPPTSCLTAHLCSFGRTFASHPFAPPPCGDDLAVRLRLAPQAPGGNLSSRQTRPLPGTLAQAFQPAGSRNFPVPRASWPVRIGDWKVPRTRRQECPRYSVGLHVTIGEAGKTQTGAPTKRGSGRVPGIAPRH